MSDERRTQICRLCLATTVTCFSLIQDNEDAAMLEALTSLKILPADEISTVMCVKCRLNLKLAFTIRRNMLNAEQRFRERLVFSVKQEPEAPLEEIFYVELAGAEETKPKHVEAIKRQLQLQSCACDICGKVVASKAALTKHNYNCHTKQKCPTCGKLISAPNLSHHVERHKMLRTICEVCGKSVIQPDLRFHMRTHGDLPRHQCRFCEKSYLQKCRKVAHELREHLKQANFVCDTCGKKFYQDRDLTKHVESTHLKLRPHVCEFCKVGFSSICALSTHRRKHTDERPFKCDFCAQSFRQRVSLKTHLKSKHKMEEELTVECTECAKMFASKAALVSHSRIHL